MSDPFIPGKNAEGKLFCTRAQLGQYSQDICDYALVQNQPVYVDGDLMLVQTEYERTLRHKIASLQTEINFLKSRRSLVSLDWDQNRFNYLAVGNSITLHGYADYWWNEIGMAASKAEKDYFHLVTKELERRYGSVFAHAFNFATWEVLATDRAETLELLNGCLSDKINLITVQLGENVSDIATYETDFAHMLHHIQRACPRAQILVIGDFWFREERDEMKERAANACRVPYISLKSAMNDNSCKAGLGTTVFGTNGEAHVIEHAGVAAHPGDKGMQYIADSVIKSL